MRSGAFVRAIGDAITLQVFVHILTIHASGAGGMGDVVAVPSQQRFPIGFAGGEHGVFVVAHDGFEGFRYCI